MPSHDGPTFLIDKDDGETFYVGQCSCGWETGPCDTQGEADKQFEDEHLLAALDRFLGYDTGPYRNVLICNFCGNEGHSHKNCSRRPLLAF